jgi:hypothetical protein
MQCYRLVFRFYSMGSYMYTVGLDVDTRAYSQQLHDHRSSYGIKILAGWLLIWFYLRLALHYFSS